MWTWAEPLTLERRNTSGLTILEIVLSIFLVLILVLGWYSVYKKHANATKVLECTSRKWSWLATMEGMVWEVQKWEAMAGQCLDLAHNPLRKLPDGNGVELDMLRTVQPNMRTPSAANILVVPPSSEFISGDSIVVCTSTGVHRGLIREIHIDANQNVLDVTFDPVFTEVIPAGAVVASVQTISYLSEPSMNPPERILYRATSTTDRKPITAGFDRFESQLEQDEKHHLRGNVLFSLGTCEVSAPVHATPLGAEAESGRWWVRGSNLVFEPWKTQEDVTP